MQGTGTIKKRLDISLDESLNEASPHSGVRPVPIGAAWRLSSVIRLSVLPDLAYREVVTRAVATACKLARTIHAQLPEEFSHEFVSAIGEAFNNLAIHGHKDRPLAHVEFEIRTCVNRLEVVILDSGASFNPDAVPMPELENLPESGMGLFIIRSCVDELLYESGPPNRMILVKQFSPNPAR